MNLVAESLLECCPQYVTVSKVNYDKPTRMLFGIEKNSVFSWPKFWGTEARKHVAYCFFYFVRNNVVANGCQVRVSVVFLVDGCY